MGNKSSSPLVGRLSAKDVDRLQRRFMRMAGAQGTVAIAQFQNMPELGGNPFLGRILQLFDSDQDGSLTVMEFTQALEYFGNLDQEEEQYKFAFRLYDLDNDGLVSARELYSTLSGLLGAQYTEAQLEQVVAHTMRAFDADGDSCLNMAEFKQLLDAHDLRHKMGLAVA